MSWYLNEFGEGVEDLPSISLVTPSYNQAEYIETTLSSVLDQQYPALEYLVVDGGSEDESPRIIERYESGLDYWQSEPDRGMYDAINQGFERSTGDIMGWLNSDDLHLPWTLHIVGSIFTTLPQVNWLTTLHPGRCGPDGVPTFKTKPGYSREAFVQGRYGGSSHNLPGYGYIQQESTFWRRSLWEAAEGLSIDYEGASDFDLWCQFYSLDRLYGVDVPLGMFRRHPDQKTSDSGYSYRAECEAILDRRFGSDTFSVQQWATYLRLHRTPLKPEFACHLGYEGPRIERPPDEKTWVCRNQCFL